VPERAAGGVLVQGPRLLSELRRSTSERNDLRRRLQIHFPNATKEGARGGNQRAPAAAAGPFVAAAERHGVVAVRRSLDATGSSFLR
jgi:hypothetical protein